MSNSHYFSAKPTSRDKRGIIKTVLRGREYSFLTSTGVFSSKRIDNGTRVLVENMVLPETGTVLDMGCGIGVIGIVAASVSPSLEVHLSDVNERAVNLTRDNIRRNKAKHCHVHQGFLYEPLGDLTFNLIVSNPPISAGMRRVVFPLVEGAYERLRAGGSIQLVIQSNKGGKMLAKALDDTFGEHSVLARKSGYRVLFADRR
jgi:16S rRNA (guanine1207-N2)-methyltransferase